MKKICCLLSVVQVCLLAIPVASGQEIKPVIQWQRTLGGLSADNLFAMQPTPDHGYILGGFSNSDISGEKTAMSKGGQDYWLIKLDSAGTIEWQKTIGGNENDMLSSITLCPGGGYLVSGTSGSGINGDKTDTSRDDPGFAPYLAGDIWLLRLDNAGTILWQKTYGGLYGDGGNTANNDDLVNMMYHITQVSTTSDGGFLVGTSSSSGISGDKTENNRSENNASLASLFMIFSDYWVLKLDALGNLQWQKTLGGEDIDQLCAVAQTTDGGYIIGGTSNAFFLTGLGTNQSGGDKTDTIRGNADYWVVKLSASGSVQWQKTIGGTGEDRLAALDSTPDGGCILGGYSNSGISGEKTDTCKGTYDYWILKLSSTGAIQWQKTIGGNGADILSTIKCSSDGGYLVSGTSASGLSGDKSENGYGGLTDFWLMKLNTSGNIIWQKTIGGNSTSLDSQELPTGFSETADNGYIAGGISNSGISGLKTDTCRGDNDYWILKLGRCEADTTLAAASFCGQDAYTLPDGNIVYLPGTYYSLLSGQYGCDSVVATNLSQVMPDIAISAAGNTLSISPTPGATYQWFSCSTLLPVAGATSAVFQPLAADYYAVVVSLNGCTDTSMCYNGMPTGINETDDGSSLLVYPNPASDFVWLQPGDRHPVIEQVSVVELATGRNLYRTAFDKKVKQRYRVDMPGITPGSYLLRIQTPSGSTIRRLQILQ